MKNHPTLALCGIAAILIVGHAASAATFTDNFNRPDSSTVGNGWSDVTTVVSGGGFQLSGTAVGGTVSILNNQATYIGSSGVAGIYRPFVFTLPVSVTATFYEMNGFGGLTHRFDDAIAILSNGTIGNGYGLHFGRSDENYFVSDIQLFDGTTVLGTAFSSFQFTSAVTVQATFNADGSITGSVAEGAQSSNFSFGTHSIASNGSNFIYGTGSSAGSLKPRLDDIAIVPEPTSAALLIFGAALCLRRRSLRTHERSA